MRKAKKLLTRGLSFDARLNSWNKLYKKFMDRSKENFDWDIGSERDNLGCEFNSCSLELRYVTPSIAHVIFKNPICGAYSILDKLCYGRFFYL